jgi:hypothetical protein
MRRLLASAALLAAVMLVPITSAQAAVAPTDITATLVLTPTPHLTVSFTPILDLGTTYTALMCQSSVSCTPTTDVDGPTSPIDVPVVLGAEFSCLVQVTATDFLGESDPAPAVPVVVRECDQVAPALTPSSTGGNGCVPFVVSGTAVDQGAPVQVLADGNPVPHPVQSGLPYADVSVSVTAADAVPIPNIATAAVIGKVEDPTGPGPVTLEVTTDPSQQRATLGWDPVVADGAPVQYRLRIKGPQGPTATAYGLTPPVVQQGLQVDATYEFTLDATDFPCNRTTSSVRLVRLNDSTPPTAPIVAGPSFDLVARTVKLSWVASSDNIQVDHYVILRDGVPLGATDATTFADLAPPQHANLNYIVRAVDTNGNSTDSAAAPILTPDWMPPTAPVLAKPSVKGSTVTLRWPPAADNVGVVGYEVFRDDVSKGTMTATKRSFVDTNVPPGVHAWRVRARDDANLTATSTPVSATVRKVTSQASVLALRMVGGGSGASRYSLRARGRLLVDLRIVGTVSKPRLRIYVNSGRGRVTAWRGTPGSSAPRLRLGSALVRKGYVTIRLNRTFYAGRSRLVLIAGGRVVIDAKGSHKPSMRAG